MSGSERQPEGSPKGRGVFHKTRLSDIPRQRLHKAIDCLASAQPTNAVLQSLTRLHKLRRLTEPLRFADANHLPFQGRQSILNAIWYQNVFRIRTYTHSIQYLRWMFTQLVNNHQRFKRYDIFRWCQARNGLYAIDWQILMNCSMMGFESE